MHICNIFGHIQGSHVLIIKEELYMMQPEGFVDPKGANKVCKAPVIHLWTGASISELEYTL